MRLLLKLAVAGLRGSKMRLVLTSLATIAAATMVVWVGASYDALLKSFKDYSADALGHYQLSVAGISTFSQYAPGDIPEAAMRYVPETVVGQLRADPAVAAADPMWARRVEFTPPPPRETPGDAKRPPPQGARRFGRATSIRVIATDAAQPPFPMAEGRWIKPEAAEVAITVGQAKRYGIQLGDTLKVGSPTAQVPLKVVGVVAAPAIKGGFTGMVASGQLMTPGVGGLYIGFTHATRWSGSSPRAWSPIAEGVLVGVVAVVLSCGLGILAGYCGAGISQYISFFGGWHPPLVIPWSDFWIGLVAALVLAAVAAIGPAISVGRAEPLTLLQRGRAST